MASGSTVLLVPVSNKAGTEDWPTVSGKEITFLSGAVY
jgi:hypothetical protein